MVPKRLRALCVLVAAPCWPVAAAALVLAGDLPTCPAKTRHCIAIHLFINADDDASGWLRDQLTAANDRLRVIDAAVQVVKTSALPDGFADIASTTLRSQLGGYGAQTPLRWFVVRRLQDDTDPNRERKGVTWRDGSAVWVIEARSAWRWVLAHELGHVLGLGHSREAASIMNKTPRAWPPPWKIGFTPREQPTMRRTLAALLRQGRVSLVAPPR